MTKTLGYILISIPYLCVLFIGLIIPSIEWWIGFLAFGLAIIVVSLIVVGVKLIN
jgi:hypothetical protein